MNELDSFVLQVRTRSNDNNKSFKLLFSERLYGNCVSILRQELDSMIRVIFLLSIKTIKDREDLLKLFLSDLKWFIKDKNGKKKIITDKDMVNLSNKLNGWTSSVYKFGCSYIHLSKFHEYGLNDPFAALSKEEKSNIIKHMSYYHHVLLTEDSTINDIIPYLPGVFEKIKDNLDCYIKMLKENRQLD